MVLLKKCTRVDVIEKNTDVKNIQSLLSVLAVRKIQKFNVALKSTQKQIDFLK